MAASKNFIITRVLKQWEQVPELRFMQLISNFQSYMDSDCFYMDDKTFITELRKYVDVLLGEERDENCE